MQWDLAAAVTALEAASTPEIWANRITVEFPGKAVAFFLGGAEDVIVRFHVRRDVYRIGPT